MNFFLSVVFICFYCTVRIFGSQFFAKIKKNGDRDNWHAGSCNNPDSGNVSADLDNNPGCGNGNNTGTAIIEWRKWWRNSSWFIISTLDHEFQHDQQTKYFILIHKYGDWVMTDLGAFYGIEN